MTSLLQITPDPLHFGFTSPQSSVIKSVTVANIGHQVIQLLAPGPSLGPSAPASGFSFGPPLATTPSSYPFALAAGESVVLPISFVPPLTGFFRSSLSLASDDVGAASPVVPIDGYGGGARIACLPSSVDFGAVAVATSRVESVICTNVGSDVPGHPEAGLRIGPEGLASDNPLFTAAFGTGSVGLLPDGGFSLMAGQSVELEVTYAPSAAASDTGTLTVASNDSLTPELAIPLAGQGVVPGACSTVVAPGEVSFGEVPVGSERRAAVPDHQHQPELLFDQRPRAGSRQGDPAFSFPGRGLAARPAGRGRQPEQRAELLAGAGAVCAPRERGPGAREGHLLGVGGPGGRGHAQRQQRSGVSRDRARDP